MQHRQCVKFIDGLFDFLIPLVYFYLPILNNQDGVNLLELKFELLITIFVMFSFSFSAFYGMRHRAFKPVSVDGLTFIGRQVVSKDRSSNSDSIDNKDNGPKSLMTSSTIMATFFMFSILL